MIDSFNTPILLLTFNRYEPVVALLEVLRKLRPSKLYIASDGYRIDFPEEKVVIDDIRSYMLNNIDWKCEVHTLFRDENLGCKKGVHEAIQWFFSNNEQGIVLEDDCIPTENFFAYCEHYLDVFKDNEMVATISGRNELGIYGNDPIVVSRKFVCWGWASWSNRILGLDVDFGYSASDKIPKKSDSLAEKLHVKSMFGVMQTRQVNSWALSYDLSFRKNNQFCIVPNKNMITNIGFGKLGTHSFSKSLDEVFRFDEFSYSSQCNANQVKPDGRFVKEYVLSLYPWWKLILLSQIKYLYPLRSFKKKLRRYFNG